MASATDNHKSFIEFKHLTCLFMYLHESWLKWQHESSSKIRLSAAETVHGIRWRPPSRSISPPDDNFCLNIAKSPLVHLQVLSSFALSSVSPLSSCLSGPGGWMSHCYQTTSDMLLAVFLTLSLRLCLSACLLSSTCCLFAAVRASLWFVPLVPHLLVSMLMKGWTFHQPTRHPHDGM